MERLYNLALLSVAGTLIAAVYASAKLAGSAGLGPLGLLAWQLGAASLILGGICLANGTWPRLDSVRLRYLALAGMLGVSGPNLVTFHVLQDLPAGVVGVVAALSPLFTYLIVIVLRQEAPKLGASLALLAGFIGVAWALWPAGKPLYPLGAAMASVLAPLLLAAGNVYRSFAWPEGLTPLPAAAVTLLLQAIVIVPLAAFQGQLPDESAFATVAVPLGVAALGSAAFFLATFRLQRRAGAVITGQLGYVITLASLAIGAVLFDERPSGHMAWAVLLVVGSVLVLTLARGAPAGESACSR